MRSDILKDKRIGIVLTSSLLWGLFAHGMAMFNKYSYHDDVPWFNGVGETYGLGRWFLAICGKVSEYIFCSKNYSTPVFNGILTILGIAVMVFLICRRLDIENKVLIVGLTGVMVCFPSVTNIFGFVFTAPHYYIGAALGVVGAYLFSIRKDVLSFIVCSVLMALSVGLYQSNIGINLIVLLLFMLADVYSSSMDWKRYFILAGMNCAVCAAFMALYFAANAICLKVTGLEMYNYKGVNSFGATGIGGYFWRVFTAYKRFLKPADFINYDGVSANMFPWNLKYLHMLLIVITVILTAILLEDVKSSIKRIQIGIIVLISPLFSYFIYVMVAEEDAHGGMAYAEVFMFALAAFVISRTTYGTGEKAAVIKKIASRCAVVVILIMAIMFARFANVCYLKVEIMQAEAISYYTTLIARIQGTQGYTPQTPIDYIGAREKNDEEFSGNKLFDPIYLPPYQGNSIINDFTWEETMNLWCGFSRVHGSAPDSAEEEIAGMPVYPADGSIKMIDGTIVVKFALK